ncbi:hypothetical protein TNCV_2973381 [Trichonephila clavipes]|nr:hypothetical protein TNCV_2973381 [Trichonephila clavipes]
MGHFLKSRIYCDVTGLRYIVQPCLLFTTPAFFSSPSLFSPVPTFFSSVVARSSSLSRLLFDLLPGAGSSSLHAPPKSKICPLWLILPFQTPGTENPQTEHTIIATVKSLEDCSSQSSLKQTHEIILIVHPIEISDYVPRKI